jgi:hypothetical protein
MSKVDVVIARPSYSGSFPHWNEHCVNNLVFEAKKAGLALDYSYVKGAILPKVRQDSVNYAMERQANYLLTIDADQTFPPDALLKLMEHKVDIASALYYGKTPPFPPVAAMRDGFGYKNLARCGPYTGKGLMEVDAVGAGFLLVKMDVFRNVPKPHWLHFWNPEINDFHGEDFWFCRQAIANKYKVMLDTDLTIGHIGPHQFTEQDFFRYMAMRAKAQAEAQAAREEEEISAAAVGAEKDKIDRAIAEKG